MPEISLLNPTVINGVVEKFTTPDELLGLQLLPRIPHPFPVATWDVIRGSRELAHANVPGSEAHVVKQLGVAQMSARFLYVREKKAFEPTTLHWLRAPGQLAQANAEAAVLRETQDLANRIDRFMEYTVWQMFTNTLTIAQPDVNVVITYGIAATHRPTAGVLWTDPAADIIGDIKAWKRLVTRDGQTVPRVAFANDVTMEYMTRNTEIRSLMSERQSEEFLNTGMVTGLLGLTWVTYDIAYVDANGDEQRFIPDGKIIIASDQREPWHMASGPSADDEAPTGHTGRFTKSWQEKDPSARVLLMEDHFLPILLRVENVIYATVG